MTAQYAPGHVPNLQCGSCEKQEVRLFVDGERFALKCDACSGVGPFRRIAEVPRPSPSPYEPWDDFAEVCPVDIPDYVAGIHCRRCGREAFGLKMAHGARQRPYDEGDGTGILMLYCAYCSGVVYALGERGYPPLERLSATDEHGV